MNRARRNVHGRDSARSGRRHFRSETPRENDASETNKVRESVAITFRQLIAYRDLHIAPIIRSRIIRPIEHSRSVGNLFFIKIANLFHRALSIPGGFFFRRNRSFYDEIKFFRKQISRRDVYKQCRATIVITFPLANYFRRDINRRCVTVTYVALLMFPRACKRACERLGRWPG